MGPRAPVCWACESRGRLQNRGLQVGFLPGLLAVSCSTVPCQTDLPAHRRLTTAGRDLTVAAFACALSHRPARLLQLYDTPCAVIPCAITGFPRRPLAREMQSFGVGSAARWPSSCQESLMQPSRYAVVCNPHFTSAAAGLAELLANPAKFYVNFHSD